MARRPRRRSHRPPPRLKGRLLVIVAVLAALGWLSVRAHNAGWVDLGGFYTVLTGEDAPSPDGPQMAGSFATGPEDVLRLVSWNLSNFGRSKDDAEMAVIADILAPAADVVAIQEVSTTSPGTDAVVRLHEALNRRQGTWDWTVSNPTSGGGGSERYAYLWRTDRVRIDGQCVLAQSLEATIDREPFLCAFVRLGAARTEPIRVASFHAVPRSKDPDGENRQLVLLHDEAPQDDLVIVGDFNLPSDRPAFDGLRLSGFQAALAGQKTTLKTVRTPSGEHLANPYDNIFYEPSEMTVTRSGVLDFSDQYSDLRDARAISDHLPVFIDIAWH